MFWPRHKDWPQNYELLATVEEFVPGCKSIANALDRVNTVRRKLDLKEITRNKLKNYLADVRVWNRIKPRGRGGGRKRKQTTSSSETDHDNTNTHEPVRRSVNTESITTILSPDTDRNTNDHKPKTPESSKEKRTDTVVEKVEKDMSMNDEDGGLEFKGEGREDEEGWSSTDDSEYVPRTETEDSDETDEADETDDVDEGDGMVGGACLGTSEGTDNNDQADEKEQKQQKGRHTQQFSPLKRRRKDTRKKRIRTRNRPSRNQDRRKKLRDSFREHERCVADSLVCRSYAPPLHGVCSAHPGSCTSPIKFRL